MGGNLGERGLLLTSPVKSIIAKTKRGGGGRNLKEEKNWKKGGLGKKNETHWARGEKTGAKKRGGILISSHMRHVLSKRRGWGQLGGRRWFHMDSFTDYGGVKGTETGKRKGGVREGPFREGKYGVLMT